MRCTVSFKEGSFGMTKSPRLELVTTRKTVGPIGLCIYCGKTSKETKLTDEHEIPFSLDGRYELLQASCKGCAKITGEDERSFTKEMYGDLRSHLKMRSRRPKQRPRELSLWYPLPDGSFEERKVPIESHPPMAFFPIWDPPGLWTGNVHQESAPNFRWRLVGQQPAIERLRKEGHVGMHSRFNPSIFCRVIAKIAHCLAIAKYGVDGFKPALQDFIIHKEDWPFDLDLCPQTVRRLIYHQHRPRWSQTFL
jgi:hypothetical protein